MPLNNDVQRFIDTADYAGLAAYYWALLGDKQLWVAIGVGGFIGLFVLMIMFGGGSVGDPDIPVAKRTRRWWWHKPGIPFDVGGEIIDLQPRKGDAINLAIGGMTGTGKSSALLPLLDLDVGVLFIALDNTTPVQTRLKQIPDSVEWTNEPECQTPWNFLQGKPELVSEQLTAGWPHGPDTGHYRRIARMRMWDRLEQADRDGEVRTLPMLISNLMQPVESSDPMVGRACREWGTKLAGMYRVLGANSIGGPGDLDLVDAMRTKKKVLMRLNAYLHPEDAPTLGGMLLVHARRVAQEAGVPFVLVIEEAGMLERQQEHIKPLAQAVRDRGVSLIIVTQNLSKLPTEVRNNIGAWVCFAQEDDVEIKFAANRLRLKPTQLWREAFKHEGRRWAYVKAPGIPTTLVRIAEVKPLKVKKQTIKVGQPRPAVVTEWEPGLPMIDHWQPWSPALPEPRPAGREQAPHWVGYDQDMLRFWGQMKRTRRETPLWSPTRGVWWVTDGCLEWHGPLSKPKGEDKLGRPRSNVGRKSVTVYVETARAAGKSVEPTWDHHCDNPVCCDPEHGDACSIAENNANRRVRAAMLEKAWLDKLGQIPPWWANRHHELVAT